VQRVRVMRDEGISEDEIPVVLFIAQHSGYQPYQIIQMRRQGRSWMSISSSCGVDVTAYGIPYREIRTGPPYGNAYGYYKHHGKKGWQRHTFSDDEIIASVNTRFLTARYGDACATEVNKLHSVGRNYPAIYTELRQNHDRGDHNNWNSNKGGHGKGRGHNKGWKYDN